MKVGVELFIVFTFDGYKAFRCFVPYDTDRKYDILSVPGFNQGTMAYTIVDVANMRVIKHRGAGELELSNEFMNTIKSMKITEYDEVKRYLDQPRTTTIGEFNSTYHFLSNFYPATFMWCGIYWHNSEAAYQGAKAGTRDTLLEFAKMSSPAEAKRAGKTVSLRPDWDKVKVQIMRDIVFAKFNQNPDLRDRLLATDNAQLEEGNMWKDTFWGVCPPYSAIGENHLGKILMELRRSFRSITF